MKTNMRRFVLVTLMLLAFALVALWTAPAWAQDAPPDGISTAAQDAAGAFLVGLASKYPLLTTILFWIGVVKLCVKPFMLLVEAVVAATPSQQDDAKLKAFEAGPVYRWLIWGLDWLTGLKTPNAIKAGTTNPVTTGK